MEGQEKKERFIELRGKGLSYDRIAKQLQVSRQTLITWSKELEKEIANFRAIEMEALQEQFYCTKQKRVELMGKQLQAIQKELEKRDLTQVSTERLFDLLLKITNQLKEEEIKTVFKTDMEFDISLPEKTWEG